METITAVFAVNVRPPSLHLSGLLDGDARRESDHAGPLAVAEVVKGHVLHQTSPQVPGAATSWGAVPHLSSISLQPPAAARKIKKWVELTIKLRS